MLMNSFSPLKRSEREIIKLPRGKKKTIVLSIISFKVVT